MKSFSKTFMLLLAFATIATGCDSNDNNDAEQEVPQSNIVEVAVDAGFSTLVTAVETAELTPVLEGEGPYTVFAPTNAAFDALPEGTVQTLLEPENRDQLTSILTYHVVAGEVTAEQVVNISSATTVQGEELDITVENGTVFVNGAEVVQADVQASNGVIHVIDSVLLPPSAQ